MGAARAANGALLMLRPLISKNQPARGLLAPAFEIDPGLPGAPLVQEKLHIVGNILLASATGTPRTKNHLELGHCMSEVNSPRLLAWDLSSGRSWNSAAVDMDAHSDIDFASLFRGLCETSTK